MIVLAQFGHFKIVGPSGAAEWMSGTALYMMLGLVALTMLIIYLLPLVTKVVPSALVAILVVSGSVIFFGLPTKTVGDLGSIAGGLPTFHIPTVPFNFETLRIIFPYSLILAAVGLIETLLTLNLIDEMTGTRGKPNRETLVQGIANIVTGFFGGMGGCAMIGQSMININNGALKRLSGVCASVFLLCFILFGARWIEMIPLAALIGVMFVVCEKTFEWGSIRTLTKIPKQDAFVVLAVTIVTVFTDLAVAVVAGVIIGALFFAWDHAKQLRARTSIGADGAKVYEIQGSLFFASTVNFASLFTPQEDPASVVLEFKNAKVADQSALEAIESLAKKYEVLGKRVVLRHLSSDCQELLRKSGSRIEVNPTEDPTYHVADDRLS